MTFGLEVVPSPCPLMGEDACLSIEERLVSLPGATTVTTGGGINLTSVSTAVSICLWLAAKRRRKANKTAWPNVEYENALPHGWVSIWTAPHSKKSRGFAIITISDRSQKRSVAPPISG